VMNLQRFNSLPAEQRRALLEAAQAAAKYGRTRNAEVEREAIDAMRRAGVEVVEEPDVEAFREVLGEGVRAAYVAEHGGDVLERIDALRPTAQAAAAAKK
jgi:TRAP-type C4-dicarboxylate transport system substrate-binding protein